MLLSASAAWTLPASAGTIYDTDIAGQIRGPSPQVRSQLRTITNAKQAQIRSILLKHGIDPSDAKPDMDKLMKASNELEAAGRREREAVRSLLKPEEMAQYNAIVAATAKRVREAAK